VANEPARTANDVPARRIAYTIDFDDIRIRQTVLIAILDGRAMYANLTEWVGGELSEAERSLILDQLELLPE
jgi:hypothetical protein